MNEACLNFLGESIATEEGKKFAIKVLDHMRERLEDFQLETQQIFNLEATPAESTSYDLALKDKKKFKDIIVANEEAYKKGAEPYYTNSSWLPVNYTDDVFELLKHQDDLQTRYTGGTVVHIFLGESLPSGEAVKRLVKKVTSNFKLPYFTFTPTFSICPIHGYIKGKHEYCPICEEKRIKTECEVYSRIVGYLRPVSQWNPGKQQEFKDRKTYERSLLAGE
jgi:ribonucleoside-triphosphate reductase